ncbi:hypothetical protein LTS07_009634 [Exophiala sideris]|nr:hypothetical protein LTS07_009634 [Exophiala sideris]
MAYNNNYYYDQSYDNYWGEDYGDNSYYDDSYDYWNDEDYWYQGNEDDYSLEQYGNEYPYDNTYDQSYYGEQYGHDQSYAQSRGVNNGEYYNNDQAAYNQESYHEGSYNQTTYNQESYGGASTTYNQNYYNQQQQPAYSQQQQHPAYYHQRGIYRMSSQRSIAHSPITPLSDVSGITNSMSEMMHHTEPMHPGALASSMSTMINHTEQNYQPTIISGAMGSSRAGGTMSQSQLLPNPSISPVQPPVRPASSHAIGAASLSPNGPRALDINRAQSVRVQMPQMPAPSNQQTRSPLDVFHRMFWKNPDKLTPGMPRSLSLNRRTSSRSPRSPGGLRGGLSNLPSPPLPAPPIPAPRPVGGSPARFDPNAAPMPSGGFGFLAPRTP